MAFKNLDFDILRMRRVVILNHNRQYCTHVQRLVYQPSGGREFDDLLDNLNNVDVLELRLIDRLNLKSDVSKFVAKKISNFYLCV
jgi:hypothetical protein